MKILIADDSVISRELLSHILDTLNYEYVLVEDGESAYEAVKSGTVTIALIDWMMPRIDGLELCKRIRGLPLNSYMYIILVTSKDRKEDLLRGLESGADDYITKPFHPNELKVKLANGIRIMQLQDTLRMEQEKVLNYAKEMETLAQERARQLIHADRMATLGLLSAGIAHEINNPTTFIMGNVQMLEKGWPLLRMACLSYLEQEHPDRDKIDFFLQETPGIYDAIKKGAARISKIVKGLKTFARQNETTIVPADINKCISEARDLCNNVLKYHIKVEQVLQSQIPMVLGDPQQLVQVFVNLFINAADAMEHTENACLRIESFYENHMAVVRVSDNGPGIPKEYLDKIWQPFFTSKPVDKGTGLGLSICHGIVETHRGIITAENTAGSGAQFTLKLPVFHGAASAAENDTLLFQ